MGLRQLHNVGLRQLHNVGPNCLATHVSWVLFKPIVEAAELLCATWCFQTDPLDHMGPVLHFHLKFKSRPTTSYGTPSQLGSWLCSVIHATEWTYELQHWCRHLSARSTVDGANICPQRGSRLPFCGTTMLHNIDSGGLIRQPKEPFCHQHSGFLRTFLASKSAPVAVDLLLDQIWRLISYIGYMMKPGL